MTKTIIVDNIYSTLAALAINMKSKPSTIQLVLAEIIQLSENGIILYPQTLQPTICKKLNISPENFRISLKRICDLKLLSKSDTIITLNLILKTPFTTIRLQEK